MSRLVEFVFDLLSFLVFASAWLAGGAYLFWQMLVVGANDGLPAFLAVMVAAGRRPLPWGCPDRVAELHGCRERGPRCLVLDTRDGGRTPQRRPTDGGLVDEAGRVRRASHDEVSAERS